MKGIRWVLIFNLLVMGTIPAFSSDNLLEFHGGVSLDLERDLGGDELAPSGYVGPKNGFSIRHATLEVEGEPSQYLEYNLEMGSATCLGRGGQILLMEASLFFKPCDFLKMGFMKGHILRGFELYQCCKEVITAEKPRYFKTFAPCHPTGAVIEADYDFTETTGITAQLAYLNGVVYGRVDDEYDVNLGVIFRTPVEGLQLGGYYNKVKEDFELDGEPDAGSRGSIGLNFERFNLHLRGEYYLGKGFYSRYEDVSSEELEMRAFFVETAYKFQIEKEMLKYIQPYCMYQMWDKASNLDGEEEQKYDYLTLGVTFGLNGTSDADTKIRVNYETPLSKPESAQEEADQLIVRLQIDI